MIENYTPLALISEKVEHQPAEEVAPYVTVRQEIPQISQETIADLENNRTQLQAVTSNVQKELFPIEHRNVIEVLRAFAQGNVPEFKREKSLVSPGSEDVLAKAKELAIRLYPKG